MPRLVASTLIALVGLMTLLPQAMCPCASHARADALRAGPTRATAPRACCERCRAKRDAAAEAPRACPEGKSSCPCCEVNGGGKLLVLRGDVVRPEPLLASVEIVPCFESAWTPSAATRGAEVALAASSPVLPPPGERRAGVVLTI